MATLKNCDICQNSKKYLSQAHLEFLVDAHHKIIESGKFNFQECRIPIYSKLNVTYIRSWLADFKDQTLCDLLEFGFPVVFNGINLYLRILNHHIYGN